MITTIPRLTEAPVTEPSPGKAPPDPIPDAPDSPVPVESPDTPVEVPEFTPREDPDQQPCDLPGPDGDDEEFETCALPADFRTDMQ